jgi:hypothetical protein
LYFIGLPDDLGQCRRGHAVLLELLKRTPCFDGLMLAHVADQEDFVCYGIEAGKESV